MRKIGSIVFILFVVIVGMLLYENEMNSFFSEHEMEETEVPKLKSNQATKEMNELLDGDLFQLMYKTDREVVKELGEPIRKDLTPYGYSWWVYTDGLEQFILVGIEENIVQTVFATGTDIPIEPFQIGESYEEISKQFPMKEKVTYQTGISFYSFLLNETDLQTNPLIALSDDVFLQCYFDTFTNELSSIRIISGDVLLKQRFYEMEYRGTLPKEEQLTEEQWETIERGMKEQVFELTNVYRHRYGQSPLLKDEQVSEVAFLHSKDMYENNYFSHYGLDGSGLKERLAEKEVHYFAAGENIAAQHTDAPAAVEGWLNSEGHREALLNDEYTHLGVGVHRLYYTQNFLLKY